MKNCMVIGIGPIGGILSAHLIKAGVEVTLVDIIAERLQAMKKNGLKIIDPQEQITGNFAVYPQQIKISPEDLQPIPDYVFISTKTYGLNDVIAAIAKNIDTQKIIIFQNGLDNEDMAAKTLGPQNIFRCICNYAGGMASDNEIKVTFFNRPNYIGVLDKKNIPQAQEIAGILTQGGLETSFTDDIKRHEWQKVILNAGLAPVSAVTGLTMKEIMDNDNLRTIVEQLLLEGIKVAEGAGIRFSDDFFEFCLSYLHKGGYHKPSMALDIERGGQTEIDFINGRIVEYGERLDISIPSNRMITAVVKGIELQKRGKN